MFDRHVFIAKLSSWLQEARSNPGFSPSQVRAKGLTISWRCRKGALVGIAPADWSNMKAVSNFPKHQQSTGAAVSRIPASRAIVLVKATRPTPTEARIDSHRPINCTKIDTLPSEEPKDHRMSASWSSSDVPCGHVVRRNPGIEVRGVRSWVGLGRAT